MVKTEKKNLRHFILMLKKNLTQNIKNLVRINGENLNRTDYKL